MPCVLGCPHALSTGGWAVSRFFLQTISINVWRLRIMAVCLSMRQQILLCSLDNWLLKVCCWCWTTLATFFVLCLWAQHSLHLPSVKTGSTPERQYATWDWKQQVQLHPLKAFIFGFYPGPSAEFLSVAFDTECPSNDDALWTSLHYRTCPLIRIYKMQIAASCGGFAQLVFLLAKYGRSLQRYTQWKRVHWVKFSSGDLSFSFLLPIIFHTGTWVKKKSGSPLAIGYRAFCSIKLYKLVINFEVIVCHDHESWLSRVTFVDFLSLVNRPPSFQPFDSLTHLETSFWFIQMGRAWRKGPKWWHLFPWPWSFTDAFFAHAIFVFMQHGWTRQVVISIFQLLTYPASFYPMLRSETWMHL